MIIDVVIPAFNEEASIGKVLKEIPKELVRNIVVADNNSKDLTAQVAEQAGAQVVPAPIQGYGAACLAGLEWIKTIEAPDAILFVDADYSDYPEQIKDFIIPLKTHDLVIGSRALGNREAGSMTIPQVFGNWLATRLLKMKYGAKFTDLGPFRAIKYEALQAIQMEDQTYGWTVEMQLKIVRDGYTYTEIPVDYKNRIGKSKISGTVKGTILAGYKIIGTILKYGKKK